VVRILIASKVVNDWLKMREETSHDIIEDMKNDLGLILWAKSVENTY
jgi:hypothetical protein